MGILLQFCQSSGGIISDLCRSQSLGTSHSTVYCTILSVERCSLGNTSLHRDKMTPPLKEYSSVQYNTIQYNTIQYNTIQWVRVYHLMRHFFPIKTYFILFRLLRCTGFRNSTSDDP